MRVIKASDIKKAVSDMVVRANCALPADVLLAIKNMRKKERGTAKKISDIYLKNADIAVRENMPVCQDTGVAVFFAELGSGVKIDGDLNKAINDGVKDGYKKGYLRKSVVADPLFERKNTADNTPAVIHLSIVKGSKLKIIFMPKGAGSENMSALKMMSPSAGAEGVEEFVLDTIRAAGANPCPPIVVGVGIGGNFEQCAVMAKHAMTRRVGSKNKDKRYAKLEERLLKKINALGLGPQGLGGKTTALAVFIEHAPCHMASLPAAVNIGCHAHRHAEVVL
ncbi:fumarate hydratase subunit alpha [Parelusimicrobium proximum]|uniref:fumarate hydratase n=1 Tax=Parelusimicrobium proximum TaxID=3228953 RepID=UPI003D16EFD1